MGPTKALSILLILAFGNILWAQTDSLNLKSNNQKPFHKVILPASLILGGALISGSGLEKDFHKEVRNAVGNDFAFPIDITRVMPQYSKCILQILPA